VNSNSAAHSSAHLLRIVRQHIRQQLPQQPSLATVAVALHLSNRTLQRLLQQQHTRFRDLLASCRHETALQHLADNQLSLQQIAHQLGFEEQSSFQKAFKCWQGCSPGEFRQHGVPGRAQQHISALKARLQVNYGIN
jgi:AraC-like DNA-binding protein